MKRCKTRERERKRRRFLETLWVSRRGIRDGIKTKDGVLRKVLV